MINETVMNSHVLENLITPFIIQEGKMRFILKIGKFIGEY